MTYVECPSTGMSSENCDWVPRKGEVRDAPGVGVKECRKCQLVTHASDLRHHVNYQSGTMHRWAAGYGETLPQANSDSERRVNAIRVLGATHSIKYVLDFGCGSGSMLVALGEYFDSYGIEPDLSARESAIKQGGKVWESVDKLGESTNNQFDLVTLFHVVEHFYEPFEELQRIKSLLRPGGLLLIETPNSNDALLTRYSVGAFEKFTYWSHHPMLHSHRSLDTLVSKAGFSVLENFGCQRYSLANHLYWLAQGKPGGHGKWNDDIMEGFISKDTSESYARDLVRDKTCDTLWLVAQT